jgi:hypothetical protein
MAIFVNGKGQPTGSAFPRRSSSYVLVPMSSCIPSTTKLGEADRSRPRSRQRARAAVKTDAFYLLHLGRQEDMMLLKTHPKDGRFLWTTFRQLVSMKTKGVEMVDASEARGAPPQTAAASGTEGSHQLLCGAQPLSPRSPARSSPGQAQPSPHRGPGPQLRCREGLNGGRFSVQKRCGGGLDRASSGKAAGY